MFLKSLAVSLGLIGFFAANVCAGLSIHPSSREFVANAGKKYPNTFAVRNGSESTTTVRVLSRDWVATDTNKKKGITKDSWLTLGTTEFVLAPGEEKEVPYVVEVPKKAEGTLAAMVSFVPVSQTPGTINMMLSSSLYVTVKGTEKRSWQIEKAVIAPGLNKWSLRILINNKGNIHVRPYGKMNVSKLDGKEICSLSFPIGLPVYPYSKRELSEITDPCPVQVGEEYQFDLELEDNHGYKQSLKSKFTVKKYGEIVIK